jgi:hypothetical protein
MATQVLKAVIHMPQRKITGDGGLRDHWIRLRMVTASPS